MTQVLLPIQNHFQPYADNFIDNIQTKYNNIKQTTFNKIAKSKELVNQYAQPITKQATNILEKGKENPLVQQTLTYVNKKSHEVQSTIHHFGDSLLSNAENQLQDINNFLDSPHIHKRSQLVESEELLAEEGEQVVEEQDKQLEVKVEDKQVVATLETRLQVLLKQLQKMFKLIQLNIQFFIKQNVLEKEHVQRLLLLAKSVDFKEVQKRLVGVYQQVDLKLVFEDLQILVELALEQTMVRLWQPSVIRFHVEKEQALTKVTVLVGELKQLEVKKVVEEIKKRFVALQESVVTFYKDRVEFVFQQEFYEQKADQIQLQVERLWEVIFNFKVKKFALSKKQLALDWVQTKKTVSEEWAKEKKALCLQKVEQVKQLDLKQVKEQSVVLFEKHVVDKVKVVKEQLDVQKVKQNSVELYKQCLANVQKKKQDAKDKVVQLKGQCVEKIELKQKEVKEIVEKVKEAVETRKQQKKLLKDELLVKKFD